MEYVVGLFIHVYDSNSIFQTLSPDVCVGDCFNHVYR
jgi:hypothetical protein